ncbi:hypothetical protein [Burkholderia stabilis]|uniref:hypothetical protein n=1 Tax=Burkholderia stabilis TaxID=95485 RepID=UPI000BBB1D7B|nr:hypothetical protein [Burkholderia stabilis]
MPLELDDEQREIVWTADRRRVWAHGVKACACSQQPDLVSIGSIEINWSHVGMSAAFSTVAPSKLSGLKDISSSARALSKLSGQSANTANRAAKLSARKGAHTSAIRDALVSQAAWQGAKTAAMCVAPDKKKECE